MEKKSNRNLAYLLATTISNKDLQKISGGKSHMTTHKSIKITGDINNADVSYDMSADM